MQTGNPGDFMPPAVVGSLVDYLVEMQGKGYVPVGFNSLSFDLPIVARNGDAAAFANCQKIALAHCDMWYEMLCRKGFGCSLAAMAAPLGLSKEEGFSGVDAVKAWGTGDRQERFKVLRYCANDARVTAQVFLNACHTGRVEWVTKAGEKKAWVLAASQEIGELSFRWLTVAECAKLPTPDTSWMKGNAPDIRGRRAWAEKGKDNFVPDVNLPWQIGMSDGTVISPVVKPRKEELPGFAGTIPYVTPEEIERERTLRAQDCLLYTSPSPRD